MTSTCVDIQIEAMCTPGHGKGNTKKTVSCENHKVIINKSMALNKGCTKNFTHMECTYKQDGANGRTLYVINPAIQYHSGYILQKKHQRFWKVNSDVPNVQKMTKHGTFANK